MRCRGCDSGMARVITGRSSPSRTRKLGQAPGRKAFEPHANFTPYPILVQPRLEQGALEFDLRSWHYGFCKHIEKSQRPEIRPAEPASRWVRTGRYCIFSPRSLRFHRVDADSIERGPPWESFGASVRAIRGAVMIS